MKVWKVINPTKFKSCKNIIKYLKKKKVHVSPWIENIYNKKKIILKLQKEKFIYLELKLKI